MRLFGHSTVLFEDEGQNAAFQAAIPDDPFSYPSMRDTLLAFGGGEDGLVGLDGDGLGVGTHVPQGDEQQG